MLPLILFLRSLFVIIDLLLSASFLLDFTDDFVKFHKYSVMLQQCKIFE